MFGSNPFGQSSSSFGSQPVFGQTSSASSNPFAPKPFGSTTPFGSQAGGSVFGGTSTGTFGMSSSSPGFGSSMPAFGASSTPAFGSSSSSSSFGGSSVFGQKPAFGGFGSTPTQTSPFGSTFQQSQPAFGSSLFGSTTPFGASSQPAFGAASTLAFGQTGSPAFGATSTPAFGATSTPAFGATSTPTFGATSAPAFGSTTSPTFGSSSTAFGASNAPAFGSGGGFGVSSTPVFGSSSTPAFGTSATSAFGGASVPVFGASSSPAFGASSSPSFAFGSNPAFGQSTSTFGSIPFGNTAPPFGTQTSPFGSQTTTFGSSSTAQSAFGGQRGGSRVVAYTASPEADGGTGKLESVSAMTVYKDKSHEELRWEDYQLGDKGGPAPASQSSTGINFAAQNTQSNPFSPSPSFAQSSANPFSTTPSNPFALKTPGFNSSPFGSSSTAFSSSAFTSSTSNPFGSTSVTTPSLFGPSSTPGLASSSSPLFSGLAPSSIGPSPSIFNPASAPGSSASLGPSLSFPNTQSTLLFQSTAPSLSQTGTGQATAAFGPNNTPFGQSSLFNTPSSGFSANLFSSSQSLFPSSNSASFSQTTPSLSTPFQLVQPSQTTSGFSFSNSGQTQAPGATGFNGMSSFLQQNTVGQSSAMQNSIVQPAPVTNPFGTLPAMPQVSIGRAGTTPSIQYGISSMPVVDKPAPVRISSFLTSRHLSQRRIRLPAQKYNPKSDGPKVPFFNDDEDALLSKPKADALFIPRENPRALVIRPMKHWPLKGNAEKTSPLKDTSTQVHDNSTVVQNGHIKEQGRPAKPIEKPNRVIDHQLIQKEDTHITLTGSRAGEAAIVYEHGADIEALMPKLRRSDYYTEPRIQELAAKERAEPGSCRHVKDFVVGRHSYGSVRSIGETDVRCLDLESLIQFNDREVIVYLDESKKPPVGQGLNKPAEVTLLNIKCFEKKTGRQYTEGPKIQKYKEMLMRKAKDQGAEFVSYDPIKGEWKFRVDHFSKYRLGDEEEEDRDVLTVLPC